MACRMESERICFLFIICLVALSCMPITSAGLGIECAVDGDCLSVKEKCDEGTKKCVCADGYTAEEKLCKAGNLTSKFLKLNV
ncbi:hypothetical protein J437_LFUL010494 [Ladona fulva]|uniref:Uncharacterized protein n=1 Tax=Ladona fulva TaxID=123851 RepID=A0A8K0NVS5_LADFU|nr:hypothetical protein J437_LFUL010494 [Ladona fulva]